MSGNLTKEDVEQMSKPENYFIAKFNGLFTSQSELFENRTPENKAIREQELKIIINDVLLYANSIPVEKRVSPMLADKKGELLNFKQKLYKAQANMLKEFKPKEHQVILDFIATINEKDLE